MSMLKIKLLSLLFLILFSCKEKSINQIEKESILIEQVKNGNIGAYNKLSILYLDYKPEDFIPYAKYLADTIKYKYANIDVFESYVKKYYFDEKNVLIDSMTQKDKIDALKYLKKSRELNLDGVSKYDYIDLPE